MPRESKKGACSSHTDAAKANCLAHNRREGNVPSYVNTHLSDTNRTIYEDASIRARKSIVPLVKAAERDYTQKTGQKCQKSFTPFRESCLVVKPGVTDKQLMDFKEQAEKLTGWKCIGIWLHQDEGHAHSKYIEGDEGFAINYHAHVLWDCINHDSGKAIRADRTKLSRMQDILANAVGMERGNKAAETGRKHRSTMDQRIFAQEQRIEQLQNAVGQAEDAKNQALKDGWKGVIAKSLAMVGRGELAQAKKDLEEANEKIQSLTTQNKNLRRDNKALKGEISRLGSEIATNEEKHVQDLKDAENAKNEAVEAAKLHEYNRMWLEGEEKKQKHAQELQEKDGIIKETEEERRLLVDKLKNAGIIHTSDYYNMIIPPHERQAIPHFILSVTQDNSHHHQEQNQEQNHIEKPRQAFHFDDRGKQLLQQVVEYAIAWLTYGTKFGWLKDAFKDLCRHLGASTREQRNEVANIVGNEVGYIKDAKEKLTPTLSAIDPNERNNGLNRRF